MHSRQRTFIGAMLLVLLSAAIATPYLQVSHAAPSAQAQIINVGVIGPVDGPTLHGVSLAVDQVNATSPTLANGTPFNLSVALVDANADQIPAAVGQLKDRGVAALFGPDDNAAVLKNLPTLSTVGIPVFTAATSNDVRAGGFIFRSRASDATRMLGLVESLSTDAKATRFAVFQGNADVGSQARGVAAALAARGVSVSPVLSDTTQNTADAVPVLLQSNPDAIIAFGTITQVADLYRLLKEKGYTGNFATDLTDNRAFMNAIPVQFRNNIYGVTGWLFASESPASNSFVQAYVANFGEVPNSQAAAAYDAVYLLVRAIRQAGTQSAALLQGLIAALPTQGVQGTINPAVGNGDITNNTQVFRTNETGVPRLVASFDGKNRVTLNASFPTPTPSILQPPTIAPVPTVMVVASPTPQGVVATVLVPTLNVRYGPGLSYAPPIGIFKKDDQIQLLGTEPTFKWFVVNFQGRQAWISGSAENVSIFGDVRSLPIVPVPPTPTPVLTPTPLVPPTPLPNALPTLKLVSWSLTPNPIKLGQGFTLTVTIANTGLQAATEFAVAATFDPGGKFAAFIVPGLAAGAQTSFQMAYPALAGNAGTYNVAIVIDLNKQVNQSPEGQAARTNTITYQVVN